MTTKHMINIIILAEVLGGIEAMRIGVWLSLVKRIVWGDEIEGSSPFTPTIH